MSDIEDIRAALCELQDALEGNAMPSEATLSKAEAALERIEKHGINPEARA